MSETPQETLTTYLHRGYIKGTLGPGEVREAIRAVLAQLEIHQRETTAFDALVKVIFGRIWATPESWVTPTDTTDLDLRTFACVERALRCEQAEADLTQSESIRADQAIKRGIAEAERDTLRAAQKITQACNVRQDLRAEKAEAALRQAQAGHVVPLSEDGLTVWIDGVGDIPLALCDTAPREEE